MDRLSPPPRPLRERLLRRRFALPQEHGVWIWWLGPLAIGAAAGGRLGGDFLLLVLAALATFLFHQPATLAVKAFSGRRDRQDLLPALVWCGLYALISLALVAALVAAGHADLLWLALPGVPVFLWHLALVSRREERRQPGVELLAAGALALTAPAAYRVNGGADLAVQWSLWGLTWLKSCGAILNVYRALEARTGPAGLALGARLSAARTSLLVHALGVAAAAGLVAFGVAPWLVLVAFLLMLLHAIASALREGARLRPTRIGLRQLGAGLVFVLVMSVAYAL